MHQHRLALITGASRGIGRGFAERLAQDGYDLILTARTASDLDALATSLRKQHHVEVQTLAADLSKPQGVDGVIAAVRGRPLSLLVNNAGSGLGGPFLEQADAELSTMLAVNVVALTRLTRALLPVIILNKGAVMNVASQAAFFSMPYMASYAASKAYVLSLGEALAEEVSNTPVQILSLCPGPVRTEFFDHAAIDVRSTRFSLTSVEHVVQEGMAALRRKKRVHVVGLGVRITTWLPRLMPRALVTKVTARIARR